MIKIQTILQTNKGNLYKTEYWMQEDDKTPKRISKSKWFKLYDQNAIVLPPVTREQS
jgi:uncharacterized protein YxjI